MRESVSFFRSVRVCLSYVYVPLFVCNACHTTMPNFPRASEALSLYLNISISHILSRLCLYKKSCMNNTDPVSFMCMYIKI